MHDIRAITEGYEHTMVRDSDHERAAAKLFAR